MIFLRNIFIFTVLSVSMLLILPYTLFAQITFTPQVDTPIFQRNEYSDIISTVPQEAVLAVNWYRTPNDISLRIDLHEINPATRYFEDDGTPYFEKTIDGMKGRLFLKETVGYRYAVYDLRYVPYMDAEEASADTSDNGNTNVVVPLFSQRDADTGISIIIDVIINIASDEIKRERLYRYDKDFNLLYEESYVYTDRGAIQRLIRTYTDGRLERFVYYFSTGGLKEVFSQNQDGSSYLLSYNLDGALVSKLLYDDTSILIYELINEYGDDGSLVKRIQSNYLSALQVISYYRNKRLVERETYRLASSRGEDVTDTMYEHIENIELELLPISNRKSTIRKEDETALAAQASESVEEVESEEMADSEEAESEEIVGNEEAEDSTLTNAEKVILEYETFTYNDEGDQVSNVQENLFHQIVVARSRVGEEVVESYFENNKLIKKIITIQDERKEIYYFQEEEVFVVYFKHNKRIREEVLINGEVVETREL